jgi:hypothetical protein
MAITHELIAKAGEYTNKDGETKVRWHKCGVAIENNKGGTALNIESLPINFDGWLQMRVPLPKDSKPGNQAPVEAPADEDIPF